MITIQIHECGTRVAIDRTNGRIGTIYLNQIEPAHGWCNLSEPWAAEYITCEMCRKPVDDLLLAFAFFRHEKPVCSVECAHTKQLKQHACCELAKPLSRNCVCHYAIECPVHGEQHFGTHD